MDIDAILSSDGSVFETSFPDLGLSFSYRLLTMKEHKVFMTLRNGGVLPPFLLYEKVFERCYLGNYNYLPDDMLAGPIISVGELIMFLSGDANVEHLIEDIHRNRIAAPADTVFEYMRSAIFTAFPSYTPDDLEKWPRPKFIKTFVVAENTLSKQNPEYEMLDLSKIGQPQAQKGTVNKHIPRTQADFDKENAAIQKNTGFWESEEAERSLSRQQLQKLDNRR